MHSIDLYQLWATVVTKQPIPFQTPHGVYCLAIAHRDEHTYRLNEHEVLTRYANELKMTDRIPHAFADLLGDTLYVFTSPDKALIDEMVQVIGERVN